jgi:uncharacterized protein DUF1569
MKSLFDPDVFRHTVTRIETLPPAASRQWGKMTPAQMLEHSTRALEMACGKGPQKQVLLGKLIGWTVRRNFVGEKPFSKNGPTGPQFIVHDEPDFAATKKRLLAIMREFQTLGENGCDGHVHAFFGRMSGVEWGVTQYKHLDHHLRQFGA